jgi:outer membrane protein assembly factor BamA
MLPAHPYRRLAWALLLGALSAAAEEGATACPARDSLLVDSVAIEGLRTTRAEVVQRELGHRAGRPFSCAGWEAEKARLDDLDIFADIALRATERGGRVNLTYVVRELPPYIPFVAVSKTEQDGLSLGPSLASLNFLGTGIRAEFITRFGGTTELQASLSSGRLGDWPLQYDFAVLRVDSYNDFEEFHEDSWRVKLDLVQTPEESFLPEAIRFLYEGELFFLRDGPGDSGVLLDPKGDFVPRLAAGLAWEGRDRRHNPRRGLYQELIFTQNGGVLGGPADFREWLSDTRAYVPLASRYGLALGSLYRFRDGEIGRSYGRYDRFHAGGVNTLRGHARNAFKGKSEWILTAENRLDLIRKRTLRLWRWSAYYGLQGVLGAEGASLWDHDSLVEGDFNTGLYAGVHLLIAGVDRIRFECGSNSAKFRVSFDVGLHDKADVQRFRAR